MDQSNSFVKYLFLTVSHDGFLFRTISWRIEKMMLETSAESLPLDEGKFFSERSEQIYA